MKKKILILGSNSFSGNHLVYYLLKKNFFIIGCSLSKISEPKFNCFHQLQKHMLKDFKFEKINISVAGNNMAMKFPRAIASADIPSSLYFIKFTFIA